MVDDGGWWVMVDVVGRAEVDARVVETDGRWKTTTEGERGIPLSFNFQNRTNLISFSTYKGIGNDILSGPHAQTAQNKM